MHLQFVELRSRPKTNRLKIQVEILSGEIEMAVGEILASILIFAQLQSVARGDFASIDYHSKDLTFHVAADRRDEKLIVISTPESGAHSRQFYFSYIDCDLISNECEAGQDCFNCPKSYEAKKCRFRSPYNDSFPLGQVGLRTFGDRGERVVVDWASKAVVNEGSDYSSSSSSSSRKVQVISMASCAVQDIPIELSGEDNGMRKLLLDALPATKSFDVFYIDYRACSDSGWVRARYGEDGRPATAAECIRGLERSKRKFLMDAIAGSDSSEIILDRSRDTWVLYELRNRSSHASEFHKGGGGGGGGDPFDVARLAMHGDKFASLCWLADVEPSYSLNCTIFRVEPRYTRELSLDFHYRVRDFELKVVDFKRIYALTSSADDSSCAYDLWIFDINARLVDGPLRIQGPQCVFAHRLEPRPTIAQLSRDKVCASFAFERPSHRGKFGGGARDKRFTATTECFLHTN